MALLVEVIKEEVQNGIKYVTAKAETECLICDRMADQIGVFEASDTIYETGILVKNISSVCVSCGWNEYS